MLDSTTQPPLVPAKDDFDSEVSVGLDFDLGSLLAHMSEAGPVHLDRSSRENDLAAAGWKESLAFKSKENGDLMPLVAQPFTQMALSGRESEDSARAQDWHFEVLSVDEELAGLARALF